MSLRRASVALMVAICLSLTGCYKYYGSFMKNGGAFVAPVKGPEFTFQPNDSYLGDEYAMVYFYRPYSDWAADEIDAPSVYIDDEHYFNLRGNGYTWLEMQPGIRHLTIRRPLVLFFAFEGLGDLITLEKLADGDFEVEAGKTYFFRYSELSPPPGTNPNLEDDHPFATGDMQLVTQETALKEIRETRFLESEWPLASNTAGRSIVKDGERANLKRKITELELRKKREIEELKAKGEIKGAPWYWPFGGGDNAELTRQTDAEIAAAEAELEAFDKSTEAQHTQTSEKRDSDRHWWWPF